MCGRDDLINGFGCKLMKKIDRYNHSMKQWVLCFCCLLFLFF